VNDSGAVQERYGYDGFGRPRVMTAAFAPQDPSTRDWETLFDGYRFDRETGLYQVRFRYLHAELGRWLSRDPITEYGGLNLYSFGFNRPLHWRDSFGLRSLSSEELAEALLIAVSGLCARLEQLRALEEGDVDRWKEIQAGLEVIGTVGTTKGKNRPVDEWENTFGSWAQFLSRAPGMAWQLTKAAISGNPEPLYRGYTQSEIERQLLFLGWLLEQIGQSSQQNE
jgi:RHS repeat-associated protein